LAQAPDGRVVRISQADQQIRVIVRLEEAFDRAQNLRQRFCA
jgi:hypothetical protein